MRPSRLAFIFIILLMTLETVRLWSLSPQTMAAHFNVLGQADRFASKADFFSFELETVFVIIGSAIVSQILLVIIPIQFLNLPNRDYWLLPAQRPVLLNRVGTFLDVLFVSILVVIQVGFELAVSANLHSPIVFPTQTMLLFIAGYVIFSVLMLFWFIFSLRTPSIS